ncbi:arabinogalactan protein 41 [Euphorbia peplus]|nr:arabinogalactan protein 41 [Euphorbia peplus]
MGALSSVSFGFFVIVAIIYATMMPSAYAQSPTLAPTPAPTSDGNAVDQGIAYVLMLVALAVTYLIH